MLVSGCLVGRGCGVDGSDNQMGDALGDLLALPNLTATSFCPEEHALGVPRGTPDIHGGDGHDVLDGRARVFDQNGNDLTVAMVDGANAMLKHALAENVELAILTDMSGACGSQVISDGCRFDDARRYRRGYGVAAALLARAGIPVCSQRDFRTLQALRAHIDPGHSPDPSARDHHETDWYREYFG